MESHYQDLIEQLNVPELREVDRHETARDFMQASLLGAADGDLIGVHEEYEGVHAKLFGEQFYFDGAVAQAVRREIHSNGREVTPIYRYQKMLAKFFTTPGNVIIPNDMHSVFQITPEGIGIDNELMAPTQPPKVVLEIGACLVARSIIQQQRNFGRRIGQPFSYIPLCTPFVNSVLQRTYDTVFGRGASRAAIENKFYIGREGSVADTVAELNQSQQLMKDTSGLVDIVLASTSSGHMSKDELETGVRSANQILNETGILALRGLVEPHDDEVGIEEVVSWALDSGFSNKRVVRSVTESQVFHKDAFVPRSVETVILVK